MEYQIPQFIEAQTRVFGPLTFKQLIYVFAVGSFLAIFWFFLKLSYWLLLAIPIIGVTFLFLFWRINGRPLAAFVRSLFSFMARPQVYIWQRKLPKIFEKPEDLSWLLPLKKGQEPEKIPSGVEARFRQIEALAQRLDQTS